VGFTPKILFFPRENYADDEVYIDDAEFVDNEMMEIINQDRRERERDKDLCDNIGIWNHSDQKTKSEKK
jgi:hypothetical protein